MFEILKRIQLNEQTVFMEINAPRVAKKAKPGQFVIVMACENGERVPLTISAYDAVKGSVTIVFQTVGTSTLKLGKLNEGDTLYAFTGPLGNASEFDDSDNRVAVVGGGLGCAIALPQAKYLHDIGREVDLIAGFRNKDLIILEDEMKAACSNLFVVTDDGSNGNKGFVTDCLKSLIESGKQYDKVIAIGPPIMMKFICKLTKEYNIRTVVSMNPIMIDGTGMCGGCRLTVAGQTKFACVDGPDFDGFEVDFDELMSRNKVFRQHETESCNLFKAKEGN